ncbi:MAG: TetR/AcrR family transcriptional regulator [Acidimicrobiales bacterium]
MTAEGETRPLRADAQRNRTRILAAAEALLGERGVDVPVDDVAQRAGVGVGTLYRHFPTKEALLTAVIITRLDLLLAEVRALADADAPGDAFFSFVESVAAHAARKHDLAEALAAAGVDLHEAAGKAEELKEAAGRLLRRAQDAGAVRADVEPEELFGLVAGTCMAMEAQGAGDRCRARMLAVVCDGLRATPAGVAGRAG